MPCDRGITIRDRSCAGQLKDSGKRLLFGCLKMTMTSGANIDLVVQEIQRRAQKSISIPADMSVEEQVKNMVADVVNELDSLDVVSIARLFKFLSPDDLVEQVQIGSIRMSLCLQDSHSTLLLGNDHFRPARRYCWPSILSYLKRSQVCHRPKCASKCPCLRSRLNESPQAPINGGTFYGQRLLPVIFPLDFS